MRRPLPEAAGKGQQSGARGAGPGPREEPVDWQLQNGRAWDSLSEGPGGGRAVVPTERGPGRSRQGSPVRVHRGPHVGYRAVSIF